MAIINYSDLINDDGGIDNLIKKLDEVKSKYIELANEIKGKLDIVDRADSEEIKKLAQEVQNLKEVISKLENTKANYTKAQEEANKANNEGQSTYLKQIELHQNQVNELSKLNKRIIDYKAQLKELNRLYEDGKLSTTQYSKFQVELNTNLKSAQKQYREVEKALISLTKEEREAQKLAQARITIRHKEVTTIKEAREQNKALRLILQQTNATTKEGERAIKEMNKRIDANIEFIRRHSDEMTKQKMNVGNYTQSILEAFNATDIFGKELGGVTSALQALTSVFTKVNTSTKATIGIMRLFKVALISTGVGALVVALGSLVAYFTKTNDGADRMNIMLRKIGAVVSEVTTRFGKLGSAIMKIFAGDFAGAMEDARDAVSGFSDSIKEAVRAGEELAKLQNHIASTAGEHAIKMAQISNAYQHHKTLAADTEKSEQKRLFHAKEALDLAGKEISEKQKRLLLELEEAEMKAKQTGLLQDQVKAQEKLADYISANGNGQRRYRDALRIVNRLQKEITRNAQAQAKAELEKRINDARLADVRELWATEELMLKTGEKREDIEVLLLEITRRQKVEMIDLLSSLNKQGQFTNEIYELKRDIEDLDRKAQERSEAITKAEEEKNRLLKERYNQLLLESKLGGLQGEIDELNKDSDTYIEDLKTLFIKRYELRKKAIEDEMKMQLAKHEEGSQEYINAELEHHNKLEELQRQHNNEVRDLLKPKETVDKWKQIMNEIETASKEVMDRMANSFKKAVDTAQKSADKQMDIVNNARDRAAKGLANNLAFEQKELAKAEAEVLARQKRLERAEKVKSLYASYSANSKNAKDGGEALAKTLRDFAVLEAISASFAYGGYTGDGGRFEPAGTVHKGEFVIDKPTTKLLGLKGATMEDFKERVLTAGITQSKVVGSGFDYSNKAIEMLSNKNGVVGYDLAKLENEIRKLREYEMSKPIQTVDVRTVASGVLEFTESIYKHGKATNVKTRIQKPL